MKQTLIDTGMDPNTIDDTLEALLNEWQELQLSARKLIKKLKKKEIRIEKFCAVCGRPWGPRFPTQCTYMGPVIRIVS